MEPSFLNVCGIAFLTCLGIGFILLLSQFANHMEEIGMRIEALEAWKRDEDYKKDK